MARKNKDFPIARRPLEYIAFFDLEIRTRTGPAFIFMAYDPYLDYIFRLSVEAERSPETVLKNIYFLLEDPAFEQHNHKGFTIILDQYQELEERILRIITPENGTVLYDQAFNKYLSGPVLESMLANLKKGGG
jgi:hypothetical protein